MNAKQANEERAEQRRLAEERAITAFHNLKNNDDFETAWQWLQVRFPMYGDAFPDGEEGNTHKAAKRDGQKSVLRHILAMLTKRPPDNEDATQRPTQTLSEFTTPTPP